MRRAILAAALVAAAAGAQSEWLPCDFPSKPRSAAPLHGRYGLPLVGARLRAAPDPLPDACRKFAVPLDHADPLGRTLTYHVARYSVDPSVRRGAVWMLDGGPGGDGVDLMENAPGFRGAWEFYDILVPQHRGTGLSSPLECEFPIDVAACMARLAEDFGDAWAAHFTTTEAVRDLAMAVSQVQLEEGGETHMYGMSYGTYMLSRYSQIAPGQADTLTLDGVCPSNQVRYINYDDNVNTVTSQVLYECQADAFCAERFGARPDVETMRRAIDDYRHGRGACFQALNATLPLRNLQLAAFLVAMASGAVDDPHGEQGALLPALLLRLGRCSAADIAALRFLSPRALHALDRGESTTESVLAYHIMMSELWVEPGETAPSAEEVLAQTAAKDFATWGPAMMAPLRPAWNLYAPDEFFGRPTTTDTPTLYLNGNADTATPLYWAAYEFERARVPDKKFVLVDGSQHVTLFRNSCVKGVLKDFFMGKATAAINMSRCSARAPRKDFTATSEHARRSSMIFFGTEDAWGLSEEHRDVLLV